MTELPYPNAGWSRRVCRGLILCLLASLGAAAPARPQQQPREVSTSVLVAQPVAPELPVRDNAIVLTYEQAVETALSHNLDLVLERYVRTQSALRIYQEIGLYDLLARANISAVDRQRAITDQTQASRDKTRVAGVGVTQVIPTGGDISFDLNGSRVETNAASALNTAFYGSGGTFTFNQPLLRNFGRLATEQGLIVARTNSQISRQQFEIQLVDILRQVDDAYWNLVEAREQVQVAQESLALARELHHTNQVQVDVGTKAPLELVQSEANIASREEDIIRAQAAVGDSEDQLRRLLNLPPGELWDLPIQTATDPLTDRIPIDVSQAIATAFGERPELRAQELAIENAEVALAFARNQQRPQLDLRATYGSSGVGNALDDPLRQIYRLDFPAWTLDLNFAVPIQNRRARATTTIASLDLDRTRVSLDQLQMVVRTEVRQAARAVETAAKTIDAAKATRVLQERNLEAERKRYENGMSTSFQITRIQDDLTQARSGEVSAIVNYRRVLREFYRATGRLLEQQGIALQDEEPDPHRFSFRRGDIESYGRE